MGEGGPLNFPLTLILAPKGRGELRGTFFYAIFMTQATPANHEKPPCPPLAKGGWGDLKFTFYLTEDLKAETLRQEKRHAAMDPSPR